MIVGGLLRPFRVALRAPLETGAGRILSREGVLVVLRDDAGRSGFGEAAPLPGHPAFAGEGAGGSAAALREVVAGLFGRMPEEAFAEAPGQLPASLPAARFGLETALADLAAQARGVRLADWLAGGRAPDGVAVNALVAGPDADAVRQQATEAVRAGFRSFKLKVGVGDPSDDAKRLDALRHAVGPSARIRLDANGAWSEELARDALRGLSRFDIEYVEDPLRVRSPDDVEALARLRAAVPVAVAADDCVSEPACVQAVLSCRAADRLVLKAAALGGLTAVRELAERARACGVASVLTSTLDAAVGLTASLHLAAALQHADLAGDTACGLGTAGWLARDVATPPVVADGWMRVPAGPGVGIAVGAPPDG